MTEPLVDRLPLAAIQMVSATTVQANLDSAHRLILQAAAQGAKLVVLPEFFCLMGQRDTDKVGVKESPGDGPIQRFLADTAREANVWLIGGTVPLASPEPRRIWNACLVHQPDGTLAARYDKVHLFGLRRGEEKFDESATIVPGRTPVVCDVKPAVGERAWRVGLSVCYDVRFPEYYRALGTVRRTGKSCCAHARSKISVMCWRPRKAACTKTVVAPGATACSSILGARCWPACPKARESWLASCPGHAWPRSVGNCLRWLIGPCNALCEPLDPIRPEIDSPHEYCRRSFAVPPGSGPRPAA